MGAADTVYLVRHAKAGQRQAWEGDDVERPLSRRGWRQSEAIAVRLEAKGASSLYSSPYLRCVQTLEPLGDRLGAPITVEARLSEGEPFEPVLELIAEVDDGAVLCSHGDIVPAVIQALHRRGMEVRSPTDWRKGTIWVLKRTRDRVTRGTVWPPAA